MQHATHGTQPATLRVARVLHARRTDGGPTLFLVERPMGVSTKPIKAGGEVFAHYKRLDAAKTRKTLSARRR